MFCSFNQQDVRLLNGKTKTKILADLTKHQTPECKVSNQVLHVSSESTDGQLVI